MFKKKILLGTNQSDIPIEEQAKHATFLIWQMRVSQSTDKELKKMYVEECEYRRENKQIIHELKQTNNLLSKGIEIMEIEMNKRGIL